VSFRARWRWSSPLGGAPACWIVGRVEQERSSLRRCQARFLGSWREPCSLPEKDWVFLTRSLARSLTLPLRCPSFCCRPWTAGCRCLPTVCSSPTSSATTVSPRSSVGSRVPWSGAPGFAFATDCRCLWMIRTGTSRASCCSRGLARKRASTRRWRPSNQRASMSSSHRSRREAGPAGSSPTCSEGARPPRVPRSWTRPGGRRRTIRCWSRRWAWFGATPSACSATAGSPRYAAAARRRRLTCFGGSSSFRRSTCCCGQSPSGPPPSSSALTSTRPSGCEGLSGCPPTGRRSPRQGWKRAGQSPACGPQCSTQLACARTATARSPTTGTRCAALSPTAARRRFATWSWSPWR
jgi:hypothetical protein